MGITGRNIRVDGITTTVKVGLKAEPDKQRSPAVFFRVLVSGIGSLEASVSNQPKKQ